VECQVATHSVRLRLVHAAGRTPLPLRWVELVGGNGVRVRALTDRNGVLPANQLPPATFTVRLWSEAGPHATSTAARTRDLGQVTVRPVAGVQVFELQVP
jgi:hypothetical protein